MRQFRTVSRLSMVCAAPVALLGSQQIAQAATYKWTGAAGTNWHSASNWAPRGIPGARDSALINSGLVQLNRDAVVANLNLGARAELRNSGRLTVKGNTTARGPVTGVGAINIPAGASASFSISGATGGKVRAASPSLSFAPIKNRGVMRATVGASSRVKFGFIENSGTIAITSAGQVTFGNIKNAGGGVLRLTASKSTARVAGATSRSGVASALATDSEAPIVLGDVVNDEGGQVFLSGSGSGSADFVARAFDNQGQLVFNDAATLVSGGVSNDTGALLTVEGDSAIMPSAGAQPRLENAGTVRKLGAETAEIGLEWVNTGQLSLDSGTLEMREPAGKDTTQLDGRTTLNGGDLSVVNDDAMPGQLNLQGGVLAGSGTINGNVTNAATVNAGFSPGIIYINGNFTQTATGILNMEIGGIYAGSGYDQLDIGGTFTMGGALNMLRWSTFVPKVGTSFRIFKSYSMVGGFATKNLVTPVATYSISTDTIYYYAKCISSSGSTASSGIRPSAAARTRLAASLAPAKAR